MEGTIDFGEKTYAYKISKINGQIIVECSVIKNNKIFIEKTDTYIQTEEENKWELDRNKTPSNIELFFEDKDNNFILGNNKMKLIFDQENNNVNLKLTHCNINLNKYMNISKENNIIKTKLDCNNLIENNKINNLIIKPIVKNMCESFEKKIYEINNKKNQEFINKNKEINGKER